MVILSMNFMLTYVSLQVCMT